MAATVPGYEAGGCTGISAPAKTPAPVIGRLNREVVRLLNQTDLQQKFLNSGLETVGGSPEQLAAFIKSDMLKWDKIIKDAGLKAD